MEGDEIPHTRQGSVTTGADTGVVQQAKDCQQPPEAGRRKEQTFPLSTDGAQLCQHLDSSPVKRMLVFWPPELRENPFLLFYATRSVVTCYGSHRKRTHLALNCGQVQDRYRTVKVTEMVKPGDLLQVRP